MERAPASVESVRRYLRERIERSSTRITLARKAAAAKRGRGTRLSDAEIGAEMAARRAYRDALRALDAIPPDAAAAEASRLEAEELTRVKSALARIYEVTQHANHDIADAGDWSIVEGEAQTALNVFHELEDER
jgi:hypothetical protein